MNTNQQDTQTQTQTDQQVFNKLDEEKITQELEQKTDEKISKLKDSLVESLSGGKPKFKWEERGADRPSDYRELSDDFEEKAQRRIDKGLNKIRDEFKAKEEIEQKRREDEQKRKSQDLEKKRKMFDREWYELVEQKKMPAMSKEIADKVSTGQRLTQEEIMSDAGLRARLELAKMSQSTGKGAKVTYYEDYSKKPPGATAPVFGAKQSSPMKSSDDYTYDDIKKERELRGW